MDHLVSISRVVEVCGQLEGPLVTRVLSVGKIWILQGPSMCFCIEQQYCCHQKPRPKFGAVGSRVGCALQSTARSFVKRRTKSGRKPEGESAAGSSGTKRVGCIRYGDVEPMFLRIPCKIYVPDRVPFQCRWKWHPGGCGRGR